MRQGVLNKALCNSPLLDDRGVEALWTIYHNSGPVAHRMIIKHVLEHLTSVSGDRDERGHPHFLGTGEWVAPSNPWYRRVGGPIQSRRFCRAPSLITIGEAIPPPGIGKVAENSPNPDRLS